MGNRERNCCFHSIWQWKISHDSSVCLSTVRCSFCFRAFNAHHVVDFHSGTDFDSLSNSPVFFWLSISSVPILHFLGEYKPPSKSAIKLMYKFVFSRVARSSSFSLRFHCDYCFAVPLQKQFDPIVSFFDLLLNWLMCTLFKWSRHLFHFSQFIGRSFFASRFLLLSLSLSLSLYCYWLLWFIVRCAFISSFIREGNFKVSCSLSLSSSQWNYIINFVNWQMDYYLKNVPYHFSIFSRRWIKFDNSIKHTRKNCSGMGVLCTIEHAYGTSEWVHLILMRKSRTRKKRCSHLPLLSCPLCVDGRLTYKSTILDSV